ncbi:MAG: type II toxin-antitoxin system HicB family antitoxin [Chloroflexi bacterium]|nr:type II toxin-antitoxin system HicB family antitoxin [Bacteroidota bacterium]MCL5109871.1 type II toxin-antitoxin system HicB family antitoxin [Chloroflexota bacterium]MDA8216653.1 type II toxin-antitoxin system HicB family antitoxin [Dehalococcoidales bacterium]
MRQYTVILEWDGEARAYSAVVPALPGCASQGPTVAEALANVREAIELCLDVLREEGEPIPDDVQVQTAKVDVAA